MKRKRGAAAKKGAARTPARGSSSRRTADMSVVVSCEHAGNFVAPEFFDRFSENSVDYGSCSEILCSHRGWDPGAIDLARPLAPALDAPLIVTVVSRLVVEVNRSLGHPRLFSEFMQGLSDAERELALSRYYYPHRGAVEAAVRDALTKNPRRDVLHLSVHTFTPVLDGELRTADIGLLYDPARQRERAFCERWQTEIKSLAPDLRVRRNYPYLGTSDGLVTDLRHTLTTERYIGVELEVNQKHYWDGTIEGLQSESWERMSGVVKESLKRAIGL
ncbi:MAG: N-formylglutamate amidohydrolase [Phycisphaerales bacterium]|nr:N-formylglutamate amidohydrolase [Phycisphaerales bacterium]